MASDQHERARLLAAESRIEGISPQDALWLRRHTAECSGCARYSESLEGVVRGLRSFAFDADPEMKERILASVVSRRTNSQRAHRWALAAAVILLIAAVPVYRAIRDGQREEADARLIQAVEERVGRVVPEAMEPLVVLPSEERK